MDDEKFFHPLDFRPRDRDFSVIFTLDHQTIDPIDGAITGDNTQFELDRAQQIRR